MEIVEIEKDYINYLRNFDKFVLSPDGKDYKKERKYVGVVFSRNSFDYFIPFSSPDRKDDYDKNGNIRKSSIVVIRMTENNQGKERLLGTLRLNSMIPIFDKNIIKKYDIIQENDNFYKNLLLKEFAFIKANKEMIIAKAEKLYTLKVNDNSLPMLSFVCDFKLLEEKAKEYTPIKEQTKEQVKKNNIKEESEAEKKNNNLKVNKEMKTRETRSRIRSRARGNER